MDIFADKALAGSLIYNEAFQSFSEQFIKILDFSLDDNSSKTYKDISYGIL